MPNKNKKRYWGLLVFAILWNFVQLVLVDIASPGEPAGYGAVSVMWLLVIFYAIKGDASAIKSVSNWAIGIHCFVGVAIFFFLSGDPYYIGRGEELFFGLLIAFGIATVIWVLVGVWANGKMTEGAIERGNSTDLGAGNKSPSKSVDAEIDANSRREERRVLDKANANINARNVDFDKEGVQEILSTSKPKVSQPNRDITLDFPRARIAIEYRADIRKDWEKISALGEKYAQSYLSRLDLAPDQCADKLYSEIIEEFDSDHYPFDNITLNLLFADLGRYGPEAQRKFKEIYEVLGATFDAQAVCEKISNEYQQHTGTELGGSAVKDLPPGVYMTREKHSFRIYNDGSVALLQRFGKRHHEYWLSKDAFWSDLGGSISLTDIRPYFTYSPGGDG